MIFLDSGNLDAVREWRSWGIVEGVTTTRRSFAAVNAV